MVLKLSIYIHVQFNIYIYRSILTYTIYPIHYIFATKCRLQTLDISNYKFCLKYQRFTTSGSKDIVVLIFEFVEKSKDLIPFLYMDLSVTSRCEISNAHSVVKSEHCGIKTECSCVLYLSLISFTETVCPRLHWNPNSGWFFNSSGSWIRDILSTLSVPPTSSSFTSTVFLCSRVILHR